MRQSGKTTLLCNLSGTILNNAEVDLILTREVGTPPVEIKLGAGAEPRSLRALAERIVSVPAAAL